MSLKRSSVSIYNRLKLQWQGATDRTRAFGTVADDPQSIAIDTREMDAVDWINAT
jgi:hypothetical protein